MRIITLLLIWQPLSTRLSPEIQQLDFGVSRSRLKSEAYSCGLTCAGKWNSWQLSASPRWSGVILLCSALGSVDVHYPSPLVFRTESELRHSLCCQPQSMKTGREEIPSILNLIAGGRREIARAMLYICPLTFACKPLKPEGAFYAAGLIKAYPSWRSCACLGYSLGILKASEINFNANTRLYVSISIYTSTGILYYTSLKFAHYASCFIS